jgi:hypothetical protein
MAVKAMNVLKKAEKMGGKCEMAIRMAKKEPPQKRLIIKK